MLARNLFLAAVLGLAFTAQIAGATPPPRPTPAEVAQRDALIKRLAGNTLIVGRQASANPRDEGAHDFVPVRLYYLLPDGTARTRYGDAVRWEAGGDSLCVEQVACWTVHVTGDEILLRNSPASRWNGEILKGNPRGL